MNLNQLFILLFIGFTSVNASNHRSPIVTRIVGGRPTNILKYPFMISLQKKISGHICGGTYVCDEYVLSAAHCFVTTYEGYSRVENPLVFLAIGGVTDTTSLYVPSMQIRMVLEIKVHPCYNSTSKFNDIALIRLDRSFALANEVLPVLLPSANYGFNEILLAINGSEPTISCQILGWGYLLEASPLGHGESLMVAKVPLLNNENCSDWYKKNKQYHYSQELQICAGFQEGGVDACQGDSGGPLICKGMQIGIVSTGEGCGRREHPGLYTRVDIYLNWIEKVVRYSNDRNNSSSFQFSVMNWCPFIFSIFISLIVCIL